MSSKKETESRESLMNLMTEARAELSRATTINLEYALDRIDDAVKDGILDLNNKEDLSLWHVLYSLCEENLLYKPLELISRRMLKTISEFEKRNNARIHKGAPFFFLGISLYQQGKSAEAISYLNKAYEEDMISAGEEKAKSQHAKRALNQISRLNAVGVTLPL